MKKVYSASNPRKVAWSGGCFDVPILAALHGDKRRGV